MKLATKTNNNRNYAFFIILFSLLMFTTSASAKLSRNSDGIVTDSNTGLQWQDNYSDNGDNIKEAKWIDAINYCEALNLGGYSDWRLPIFNELYYIADSNKRKPAINSTFQNIVSDGYWSSSTVEGDEYRAWSVHCYNGNSNLEDKSYSFYVRCVRAGQ